VPGAIHTYSVSINAAGTVTGSYFDFMEHGFIRASSGAFTTVEVPGALHTSSVGINSADAITGSYVDASFLVFGYLRASDGTLATFAASSGAIATYPVSINTAGAITGSFVEASSVSHGF